MKAVVKFLVVVVVVAGFSTSAWAKFASTCLFSPQYDVTLCQRTCINPDGTGTTNTSASASVTISQSAIDPTQVAVFVESGVVYINGLVAFQGDRRSFASGTLIEVFDSSGLMFSSNGGSSCNVRVDIATRGCTCRR